MKKKSLLILLALSLLVTACAANPAVPQGWRPLPPVFDRIYHGTSLWTIMAPTYLDELGIDVPQALSPFAQLRAMGRAFVQFNKHTLSGNSHGVSGVWFGVGDALAPNGNPRGFERALRFARAAAEFAYDPETGHMAPGPGKGWSLDYALNKRVELLQKLEAASQAGASTEELEALYEFNEERIRLYTELVGRFGEEVIDSLLDTPVVIEVDAPGSIPEVSFFRARRSTACYGDSPVPFRYISRVYVPESLEEPLLSEVEAVLREVAPEAEIVSSEALNFAEAISGEFNDPGIFAVTAQELSAAGATEAEVAETFGLSFTAGVASLWLADLVSPAISVMAVFMDWLPGIGLVYMFVTSAGVVVGDYVDVTGYGAQLVLAGSTNFTPHEYWEATSHIYEELMFWPHNGRAPTRAMWYGHTVAGRWGLVPDYGYAVTYDMWRFPTDPGPDLGSALLQGLSAKQLHPVSAVEVASWEPLVCFQGTNPQGDGKFRPQRVTCPGDAHQQDSTPSADEAVWAYLNPEGSSQEDSGGVLTAGGPIVVCTVSREGIAGFAVFETRFVRDTLYTRFAGIIVVDSSTANMMLDLWGEQQDYVEGSTDSALGFCAAFERHTP